MIGSFLVLGLTGFGQELSRDLSRCETTRVDHGFQSDSEQELAWSAWCTGANELEQGRWTKPLLAAFQRALASPTHDPNRPLFPILIAALIRSRIAVPLEDVLALYGIYPDAAIALVGGLSLESDSNGLLSRLFDRVEASRNQAHWLALASKARFSNEFKQYLASKVQFEYQIDVVTSDYIPTLEYVGPPTGVFGGIPGRRILLGWPPESYYCLNMMPQSGDEALSHNVFLHVSPAASLCYDSGNWTHHSRDVVLALYPLAHCGLCASAARAREYPHIRGGRARIIWRSPEQAARLLERVAAEYMEECRDFMAALQVGSWSEDNVRSRVKIRISDLRDTTTPPLEVPPNTVLSAR